ncbi:unnamed protein product [Periconia digitata]|uniref:Uncharacterized protein n=1 Tax=Periconia digitata TaxID=1303443 RepID=A0A9W4XPK6_9PLEO|nr:unnamed protein product [Periconia digitata]
MAVLRSVAFALTSAAFFFIMLHQRVAPDKPASATAIGISLHVNYGAISIRQNDESFRDIGMIEGNYQYQKLMRRLSQRSSEHPSPPYEDGEDQWKDQPRQFLRNARKALGFPASTDVAILAAMVQELINLAGPSSSVIISYPAIPGLTQEDIADVETYLGLPVFEGNHGYPPRTLTAAYAGYDMGLCESFTNKKKCTEEELELPVRRTLLVEYTGTAFLLHVRSMRDAYDLGMSETYRSSNLDFSDTVPSKAGRLPWIRNLVIEFVQNTFYLDLDMPKTCTVILIGPADLVKDHVFQLVLKDGLKTSGLEVELLDLRPEYAASRGAAELAWRSFALAQQTEL